MKRIDAIASAVIGLLAMAEFAAAQQNPHGVLPVASFARPYLFLVRDEVVFDELRLDDRQRHAVAAVNEQFDPTLWSIQNKPPEVRDEKARELTEQTRKRLAEILSPLQEERLKQIELWVLGTRAFLRDDFVASLGLSDQQQAKIRDRIAQTAGAVQDLGKRLQSGEPREELEKEASQLQLDERKQILSELSTAQQQRWRNLLGRQVDLAALGRVKFKAPELHSVAEWLNTEPLNMERLRGKVIAVHFYAFGCINCQRNFPWYKSWHEDYARKGLVVLGIHTPETERERNSENVRKAAEEQGLTFPILIDREKENWNVWGNSVWPSVYLVDKQGYVRAWWYGELNWQGAEGEKLLRSRIEQLLSEVF